MEMGDVAAIDRFIDREETRLMREQLADGDALFPLLRELRPVGANVLLVVEPSSRVGDGQRRRRQTFARRVDHDHGVLQPRLAVLLVSNTAPEINNLLAAMVRTAGASQLPAPNEVLGERLAHGLETVGDASSNADAILCGERHKAVLDDRGGFPGLRQQEGQSACLVLRRNVRQSKSRGVTRKCNLAKNLAIFWGCRQSPGSSGGSPRWE